MKFIRKIVLIIVSCAGFTARNSYSYCCNSSEAPEQCKNRMVTRVCKNATGEIIRTMYILRNNNGTGPKADTLNGMCKNCVHRIDEHKCDQYAMPYGAALIETVSEADCYNF